MRNWGEDQQILSTHDSIILPKDLLLDSLTLQFRMIVNNALQLFLDVADGNMPGKLRMYQIFLRLLLEVFVYSHHSILVISKKQMAQLLQLIKGALCNAKSSPIYRMGLVMLYCSFLGLDCLFLVQFKELIETEVRRNLCGIGQQVKDEKRRTEWQDLNDDYRFQSVEFLFNFFLQFFLLRCQGFILDPFEHHQVKVILEVFLEAKEAFLGDMRGLFAIHDGPLKSRLAVIGLNLIKRLLPDVAVLKERGDSYDFEGFQSYHLIIIYGKILRVVQVSIIMIYKMENSQKGK